MNQYQSTIIAGHLDYSLNVKKLAHGTLRDIRCTFRNLYSFCARNYEAKEIWELSLEEYIRWINLLQDQGQTSKTINKMLSHVRGLIDYAWQLERLDRNVLDGFFIKDKIETPIFQNLSIEEMGKLVRAFNQSNELERRNRMIILLLYGCGLRTSELAQLEIKDIDLDLQEIKILGKGSKERIIPLSEKIFSELLAYLSDRKGKRGSLFKTFVKKTKLSQKDISMVVKLGCRRAQIEKEVTPKTLRHAFASHLLNQGVDIAIISMLMGHRSPSETGVYIHAEEENIKKAIFKMEEAKKEEL